MQVFIYYTRKIINYYFYSINYLGEGEGEGV